MLSSTRWTTFWRQPHILLYFYTYQPLRPDCRVDKSFSCVSLYSSPFFFYMCIFNTHIHCDLCSSSRQPLDLSQSHFGANRTEPTNRCFWLPVSEGGSISAAELLITAQPATAYIHVNNQGVACFAVRPAGSHLFLRLPSEVPQQDPAAAVALLNQILFFSFFRFFSNIIDKPAATVAFKGGNRG